MVEGGVVLIERQNSYTNARLVHRWALHKFFYSLPIARGLSVRKESSMKNPTTTMSSERSGVASASSMRVARVALIAALYAVASLICLTVLQGLAWGPVQFRISEAVCVLALFFPEAVPGLAIGCVIANIINMLITGTGALGLFDVVFGSLATFLGALWCWRFRSRPALAIAGFVVTNALIVPAYLPIILSGLGFYVIPFTDISLEGAYVAMYLFGLVATGIGEALVMYVLGYPLYRALRGRLGE